MPRKARPLPKPIRQPTFIKAWRKHKGLTLEKLSERLEVEESYTISDSQLSRIEKGQQPYSQDLLEAIARVLRCSPASLIMRDPAKAAALWELLDTMSPGEQEQAEAVITALKRTGTTG